MEELKNCPFCGHRPDTKITPAYMNCIDLTIICPKCGANETIRFGYNGSGCISFFNMERLMSNVAKMWNKKNIICKK